MMCNKLYLLAGLALAMFTSVVSFAQEVEPEILRNESCTSIMLGRKATDDGSVITAHTADSYYRTWMRFEPAMDHEAGAMRQVYKGTMHTESVSSQDGLIVKGEIPQVEHTYGYLNTAYPCMNEKRLAIGETTITGKRELINRGGMFLIEELQRVALQRCTNAREAIQLIGELIKTYGYGDSGECITIADTKEVWQLEIFGEGPDNIGGVWAAQRIPDDHVGVSANISRIGELDLDNKDFFMASENVFDVAKSMGYWDGKAPFKFWKAYSGKKPFLVREYFVFNTLAPSLNLKYDVDELPFSVKVDKKVNIREVVALYQTTYDGTEFEMIRDLKVAQTSKDADGNTITDTIVSPAAHPWLSKDRRNLLNSLKDDAVVRDRPIAVQYCSYSWIAQLRDDLPEEIGGKVWFSFDVPRLSPRVPLYCGHLDLPNSFDYCGHKQFGKQTAMWAFMRTNRLAMVNWAIGKKVVEPEVKRYEDRVFGEIASIEAEALKLYKQDQKNAKDGNETQLCQEYLTDYSNAALRASINRWWELGDELWLKMKWKF